MAPPYMDELFPVNVPPLIYSPAPSVARIAPPISPDAVFCSNVQPVMCASPSIMRTAPPEEPLMLPMKVQPVIST